MNITIGADGKKNCHITLSGALSSPPSTPVPIVLFEDLSDSPTKLRIDAIQFAIQEKMGLNLWWIGSLEGKQYTLILPLESRGGFDFERIKPLSSPEGAIGIAFTAFKITEKEMTFLLMLDLTKQ